MDRPVYIATEKNQEYLSLIVDKEGMLGGKLALILEKSLLTVLVSSKKPEATENTVFIPFEKTMPQIPNGVYSHIFFFFTKDKTMQEILTPVIKKAKEDTARVVFVVAEEDATQALLQKIRSEYKDALIAVTGDIFGETYYDGTIAYLFTKAKKSGKMTLGNMGLSVVEPVQIDDCITGILQVGLGTQKGETFLLYSKHYVTELAVAHALQKIDPLIKIDFSKIGEKQKEQLIQGQHIFDSSYEIIAKMQQAYMHFVLTDIRREDNQKKIKNKTLQGYKAFFFAVFLFLLAVFILYPVLGTIAFGFFGKTLLQNSLKQVEGGNITSAQVYTKAAASAFDLAQISSSVLIEESNFFGNKKIAMYIDDRLSVGKAIAETATNGYEGINLLQKVFTDKSKNPASDFQQGLNNIKNAIFLFQKSGIEKTNLLPQKNLSDLQNVLGLLTNTIDVYPSVFGFDKKKTYLVLLQNNMELRPGGGFIGSYAVVSVDKGKILPF
ncbi:MAG: DUF4012 domain-containing protein, partial [Candidatus Levyibacteriota bacterium]